MRFSLLNALISAIVLSANFAGCGSSSSGAPDSGGGAGTGTGDAINDVMTTFDTVAEVISTSLNVSTAMEIFSGEQHVHCSNGEQATITGSVSFSAKTFDQTSSFGGCDGVNGSTGFSGNYTASGDNYDFIAGFAGSALGNGCTLTLNSFVYDFTASQTIISAPISETAKGALSSSCTEPSGTATVSCDFGTGVQANNLTLMKAACACSGAGC